MVGSAGTSRRGPWLLVLGVLLIILAINRHQWAADIRDSSDDAAYLSFAFSFGIDGDFDFMNEIAVHHAMGPTGDVPKGFAGTGLLAAPFVAGFSVLDRINGHPVIGQRDQFLHSWSYFGFSFAAHVYFLATVYLVSRCLPRDRGRLGWSLLILAGSGLLYYLTQRPRMSHVFEIFTLVLVLRASLVAVRAWDRRGSMILPAVGVAAAVQAVLLVRFSDANVVALPVLVFLMVAAARPVTDWIRLGGVYAAMLALTAIPVAALNMRLYGTPWPQAYSPGTIPFPPLGSLSDLGAALPVFGRAVGLAPHMMFSMEFGVLYTMPVIALGLVMAVAAPARGRRLAAGLVGGAYVLVPLVVAGVWNEPADSYGWRYLYSLLPLGILGLVAGPDGLWRRLRPLLAVLCVFAAVSSLFFTRNPSLSYTHFATDGEHRLAWAPDYVGNVVVSLADPKVWDTVAKDGVIGYVRKGPLRKDGAPPPHPPMVGWGLLALAGLWAAAMAAMMARERSLR